MAEIEPSVRLSLTTINDHLEKETQPIYKNHIVLGMAKAKGRVVNNCSGLAFDWPVRFRRNKPKRGGQYTEWTFDQPNRHLRAELPYRSVIMGESYTKFEQLANKGKPAIVKFVADLVRNMREDIDADFPLTFWEDGDDPTTSNLHGVATFSASSAAITNSVCRAPSDTYANLSCVLGNYGGSWTGNFPVGTGKHEYHAWSPLIIDCTSSASTNGWNASTKTWYNLWQEALSYADAYIYTLYSKHPDVFVMTPELLRNAKASLQTYQKFEVDATSQARTLGFKTLNWEGIEVIAEYGVPTGQCVGICFDELELRSMQSQLFMLEQQKDINRNATKLACDFWGNWKFNSPAFFPILLGTGP